jgi:hypothetical protein
MGLFRAIADAIYKEYDRRVKRASLVTEYGISQHQHDDAHADETHDEDAHADEIHDEGEAEIVNLPRGTPVPMHAPATAESQEPRAEDEIEDRG